MSELKIIIGICFIFTSYVAKTQLVYRDGNYIKSLYNYNNIDSLLKLNNYLDSTDNSIKLAYSYWKTAYLYQENFKRANAVKYYIKAYNLFKKLGKKRYCFQLQAIVQNMGTIARHSLQYKTASKIFKSRIKSAKMTGQSMLIADAMYDYGVSLAESNMPKLAFQSLTKAHKILSINNIKQNHYLFAHIYNEISFLLMKAQMYDSAKHYIDKSIIINNDSINYSYTQNALGLLMIRQNKYQEAIKLFNDLHQYTTRNESDFNLININRNLGDSYYYSNNNLLARKAYNEALTLVSPINSNNVIDYGTYFSQATHAMKMLYKMGYGDDIVKNQEKINKFFIESEAVSIEFRTLELPSIINHFEDYLNDIKQEETELYSKNLLIKVTIPIAAVLILIFAAVVLYGNIQKKKLENNILENTCNLEDLTNSLKDLRNKTVNQTKLIKDSLGDIIKKTKA